MMRYICNRDEVQRGLPLNYWRMMNDTVCWWDDLSMTQPRVHTKVLTL